MCIQFSVRVHYAQGSVPAVCQVADRTVHTVRAAISVPNRYTERGKTQSVQQPSVTQMLRCLVDSRTVG